MGAFCETYGDTISNRVLEYLLENQGLDVAIGDIARELGISRPKTYEVIAYFEEKGYVLRTRVVGRTQLFALNKTNSRVILFTKDFKECLRIVALENSIPNPKRQMSLRAPLFSRT
ncbi:MAG: helix-turn-helix domain-containing protein [Candidatus Woesearchaeota archaeon]